MDRQDWDWVVAKRCKRMGRGFSVFVKPLVWFGDELYLLGKNTLQKEKTKE